MTEAMSVDTMYGLRLVVGVGDMSVSGEPQCMVSTYSLGSCIGVVAFDPVAKAGGIIHMMLPNSSIAPDRVMKQPAMFVDTGLAFFVRALSSLGATRDHTRMMIAGGASVLGGHDPFRIGERNTRATLDTLAHFGYSVRHSVVGGGVNRALHLDLDRGHVMVITPSDGGQYSLS